MLSAAAILALSVKASQTQEDATSPVYLSEEACSGLQRSPPPPSLKHVTRLLALVRTRGAVTLLFGI